MFWPDKGLIVACLNESPQFKIITEQTRKFKEWDARTDKPPDLGHWSDIVYLTWKHIATEEQRRGLRAICRRHIDNRMTKNILAYVLKEHWPDDDPVGRAPRWPERRRITPNMEGFNALLNTPNIRGIVWMLIQHSEESKMGRKTIKAITVRETMSSMSRC